jgi:hypothetical protein
MTGIDDDRIEKVVREKTIDNILDANDLDDLIKMRREMSDRFDETDEREADLLEYRSPFLRYLLV